VACNRTNGSTAPIIAEVKAIGVERSPQTSKKNGPAIKIKEKNERRMPRKIVWKT
jgi:hypothetical protein